MKTRRSFLTNSVLTGTALILGASRASAADPAPSDFWSVVSSRRSVRRFKSDPVPEADLMRILGAAAMAPTSGNQQPWKFLVVRERERIDALASATVDHILALVNAQKPAVGDALRQREQRVRENLAGYLTAPVLILVLTDGESKYPTYNHWDGPLAAAQLMLAARALGYGTVFLTDSVPDEVTRKFFAVPDRYTRVTLIPLGVPVEWPTAPKKKPLSELVAFERL